MTLLLCVGCGDSTTVSDSTTEPGTAPLVLAAGTVALQTAPRDDVSASVDLGRLGFEGVAQVYDLSTPAGEPFLFDALSRADGNTGAVRVSVAHGRSGTVTPNGGPETLAAAGIVLSASGASSRGEWFDTGGDGFARITLRGTIDEEQVIAIAADNGDGPVPALVRLRIGLPSEINVAARPAADYPGILQEQTVYSSDSWRFGLPTVAVSGDRTSIVCYEGDGADPYAFARYELRMQHESATGDVTGGGSQETSADLGHWRDHEIAALYNVLALVHSGTDAITLKLSFDRGATFTQTERFPAGEAGYAARLVQLAMGEDYALAVVFWRTGRDGASELVLIEGKPEPYDKGSSPDAFTFASPVLLYRDRGDVTPVPMGVAWSSGGDLVVGYGFTRFTFNPDMTWESLTQFRCAVRPWNEPIRDTLVEEERIVGKDPSVALVGSGDTMRILYAYEGSDGIRLRTSSDAGRTFGGPVVAGDPSAHQPTVLARRQDGAVRVDLLYLAYADAGVELRLRHWDDFDGQPAGDYRLTQASLVESGTPPPIYEPGIGVDVVPGMPPTDYSLIITQVAWFGYDAVLDGQDVVVVYDEETFDAFEMPYFLPMGRGAAEQDGALSPAPGDEFIPAEPPPLAPGMTEEMPPPDPTHMHQLRLLRLN